MTSFVLLVLSLVSRPELVPVSGSDVTLARALSVEFSSPVSPRPDAERLYASPDRIPGRFVVGHEPGAAAAARAWVEAEGGSVVRTDQTGGDFVVATFVPDDGRDAELRSSAARTPGIRYVEPDLRVRASGIPNDPLFFPYQWDKWVMYADQAWDVTGGSMGIKVAVIDNGTDYEHPELAGEFVQGQLGFDFIGNDDDPKPDNTQIEESFHGTHVAGIIAATRDNNVGVAGWVLVQLLAVRVLNDSGSGNLSDVASGIRWAADHACRIANMSLGGSDGSTPLLEACQYALGRGVLLVAASGNDGQEKISYPAAYAECMAVGATTAESKLALFSNYGDKQEVVAPGDLISSTAPGGQYVQASGTSMAAPQVSGVAGLLLSYSSGLSPAELRSILDASAIDMSTSGRDRLYGFGLVSAKRALDLAAFYASRSAAGEMACSEQVVLGREGLRLPTWVDRVELYDGAGRSVESPHGRQLESGAYFVRLVGRNRLKTVKVLVLD